MGHYTIEMESDPLPSYETTKNVIEILKKGMRNNSSKTKLSMILEAKCALEGAARVMMYGEQKYPRSNWREGLPMTEIVDSLTRHLTAFMSGETLDSESGLPHVDHLLCNAIFLSEMAAIRPDLDDRTTKTETK